MKILEYALPILVIFNMVVYWILNHVQNKLSKQKDVLIEDLIKYNNALYEDNRFIQLYCLRITLKSYIEQENYEGARKCKECIDKLQLELKK
jgi:hypothetical protein